jgi:replicative DNA helicase
MFNPALLGSDGHEVDTDDPLPPMDLLAEQSVLGAMMLTAEAFSEATQALSYEDFYRPAHQAIYSAVVDLDARGEPTDVIAVSNELLRRGELARAGGAPYLHTLIAAPPTTVNVGYYADIVAEKAQRRRIVEAGLRITQLGYHGGDTTSVAELLDRAQASLDDAGRRRSMVEFGLLGELTPVAVEQIEALQAGEGARSVPTGLLDLDAITNGLHPGQMITVAARPGMGKSVLGLNIARSCSIGHGMTSVIFSMEMSRVEIVMRVLAAEARVRLHDMRTRGGLSEDDWIRLARRIGEISQAPLVIDDTPSLTVADIRARSRQLAARHDLRLIVVDYLQLMTSGRRVENRQQEVSEFSRQLKLLAKELHVPVVAISQLNRGTEQRSDKRPMLADLRESGSIEQDSDVVILLHRPDYYARDDPRAGEIDLILAKHRDGPTTTVTEVHQLHYARLSDLASGSAN